MQYNIIILNNITVFILQKHFSSFAFVLFFFFLFLSKTLYSLIDLTSGDSEVENSERNDPLSEISCTARQIKVRFPNGLGQTEQFSTEKTKPIKYEQFLMDMTTARISINVLHEPMLGLITSIEKYSMASVGIVLKSYIISEHV